MFFNNRKIQVLEILDYQVLLYLFENKKEGLEISSIDTYETIEDTFPFIDQKLSLIIFLNTSDVLIKQDNSVNDLSENEYENFVSLKFKINPDDFYFDILLDHNSYISIIRKSTLDSYISSVEGKGIKISQCTFGPFSIVAIKNFTTTLHLQSHIWNINIVDTQLEQLSKKTPTNALHKINLEGYEINAQHVLSFSVILSYLQKQLIGLGNISTLQNKFDTFTKNRHKQRILTTFMFVILGGLSLVGALFYTHYFQKVTILQEEQNLYDQQNHKLKQVITDVQQKEKLIRRIEDLSSSNTTFFIDTIMLLKSSDIILSKIAYQDISEKVKMEKQIRLKHNLIELIGNSSNHHSVQNWIKKLQGISQINTIDIKSYKDVKGSSEFILNISHEISKGQE